MSELLTVVPEPSTIVLAWLAAAGLAVLSLHRRRNCKT
ncbi:MAG: PEP-CTERM sorting domain-containing protein [Planctomycetia bacterium]|nr:PEP-CTERM sorting domain-containing protein [Planctomycetia bacterium]